MDFLIYYNICIALFSSVSILVYYKYPNLINSHLKSHLKIFILKLLFISMFIYFFIFNFSISNYRIFIISGYINFTIFHIIEGFLSQKILLENEIKN